MKQKGSLVFILFKQKSIGLSLQTEKNDHKQRRMKAAGRVFHLGLLNISQHDQF